MRIREGVVLFNVYLGLGSSLGDRFGNLRMAVTRLESLEPLISVIKMSSIYQSPHLGRTPGDEMAFPPHLNMVVKIRTELLAEDLLLEASKIEDAQGRNRSTTIRWGPRTLDIDILLYGEHVIHTNTLDVPHAEMANRAFVVVPLYEIEPGLRLPDCRTIEELRKSSAIRSQRLEQVATASELFL
jgi:2-amino-4-hydroxy-6-hydroxymethyldihydropteridine diphosphokinase